MKKLINIIALFAIVATSLDSCGKIENSSQTPGGDNPDVEENVFPEPPTEIIQENLFKVDFLTDLSTNSQKDIISANDIVSFIQSITEKKPLIYMIDRMDYEVGKVHPSVLVAKSLSMHPFFAQCGTTTGENIPGTSLLTIYPIDDYDGAMCSGDSFISGCKLRAPLRQAQDLTFYTSKIETLSQLKGLIQLKLDRLRKDSIMTGTVRRSLGAEMKQYIENEVGSRLYLKEVEGKDYSLFVMMPPVFVCRDIEKGKIENQLDYYRISIEKLI